MVGNYIDDRREVMGLPPLAKAKNRHFRRAVIAKARKKKGHR